MKARLTFLTVICFAALLGTARANGIQVTWKPDLGGGIQMGGYDLGTVYAGEATVRVVGGLNTPLGVLPDGYTFASFCIDLLRYAGDDTYAVDEVKLMSQWHEPSYLYPSAVSEPTTDYPFAGNLAGRNAAAWLYQTIGAAATTTEDRKSVV
jgi:hypothetical protein